MLPVNQFILSGDPLFNSNNLNEQIQYLEEQKRIIDARQNMIFESAIDFWFDDVDFGEDKLWKYFNELK